MSNPAAKPSRAAVAGVVACVVVACVLFQFFGNATRGYVNTTSMFWWWVSQWLDVRTESEHGWLILGVSAWLFWRNRRITDSSKAKPAIQDPKSAIAAMLAGLLLHALGFVAQQTRVSI